MIRKVGKFLFILFIVIASFTLFDKFTNILQTKNKDTFYYNGYEFTLSEGWNFYIPEYGGTEIYFEPPHKEYTFYINLWLYDNSIDIYNESEVSAAKTDLSFKENHYKLGVIRDEVSIYERMSNDLSNLYSKYNIPYVFGFENQEVISKCNIATCSDKGMQMLEELRIIEGYLRKARKTGESVQSAMQNVSTPEEVVRFIKKFSGGAYEEEVSHNNFTWIDRQFNASLIDGVNIRKVNDLSSNNNNTTKASNLTLSPYNLILLGFISDGLSGAGGYVFTEGFRKDNIVCMFSANYDDLTEMQVVTFECGYLDSK